MWTKLVSNPCTSGRISSGLRPSNDPKIYGWFQTPAPRGGSPLEGSASISSTSRSAFQTPAPRGGSPLTHASLCQPSPVCFFNLHHPGPISSYLQKFDSVSLLKKFQTPAPRGGSPLQTALERVGGAIDVSNPCT